LGVLAKLYGGYFAVDLRLLAWAVLLSALSSVGFVLALKHLKGTRRVAAWLVAGFFCFLLLSLLVFQFVVDYPILALKSFFEIPTGIE
jgi:hypothetical protein